MMEEEKKPEKAVIINRWKGSFPIKLLAWIALVISEILLVVSIIGAAMMEEQDIYQHTKAEWRQIIFDEISSRYSIMALARMGTGYNADYFQDKNFQYGIIEAETLDGLDLGNPNIYLESNLKDPVNPEECFIYYSRIRRGEAYFYYSDSLWNWNYYIAQDEGRVEDAGSEADQKQTLWVVSYVNADALQHAESIWGGDLYVQSDFVLDVVYGLRYSIYGIICGSLLMVILLVIFLCSGAGRRRGKEEIVLRYIDKMPFDLLLFLEISLGAIVVSLPFIWEGYGTMPVFNIFLVAFAAIVSAMLVNEAIFSFAARAKAGKWWKNTVAYYCVHWIFQLIGRVLGSFRSICGHIFGRIKRDLREIRRNIHIYTKTALAAIVLAVIELIVILGTQYDTGTELLLWMIEKAILYFLLCHCIVQLKQLFSAGRRIAEGDTDFKVDTGRMYLNFKAHGENLNRIGEGIGKAVNERMKSERFKTELITNVSHDIKTPLTSIINYVDLLDKENLQNPAATEYLEILKRQSQRLKKLIEDLMEASKASTGNLAVNMENCEAGVFLMQMLGEYEERLAQAQLELMVKQPEEPVFIRADGRHLWRVMDNLLGNACKYGQPGTRIYIDMVSSGRDVYLIFRNTSKYPLNISSEELMERFVRGDSSRNTEGSGLGLSIAKSLMELMEGEMKLVIDGDLFKVILRLKASE